MRGRSFKDYFGRNRKALYMILGILLVSISSLTIVYAALSVTLNITGNAEVVASTWDIHLDNVKVTSGSVSGTDPTITNGTTATFTTTLTTPGDFYEFTIDVVNNGTIDAMIDGVTKTPTLTSNQSKYLNYIIEYQNGESINTKQLVQKNSYVRLKVRVEYRKDLVASDLPTTSETLNLAFKVNYVQSDGSGSSVKDNGEIKLINVVSGDGFTKSDEVCIKDECFYVMYSDDTSVTMLSKMNITLDDSPVQSSSAEATVFSNTNTTYAGSIVEGYVNNYNSYLITQGVTPLETRLITRDELIELGCSINNGDSCSSAPNWVYSTLYWTKTAGNQYAVWYISSDGIINLTGYTAKAGVRPVIVISKDYFN